MARQSRRGVDQENKPPAPAARLAAVVFLFLFCGGALLRLLLCWFNPPQNAFDNHYEPIFLIMETGAIPAKDACFQCYHPPVFYWISAMIGKMTLAGGMTRRTRSSCCSSSSAFTASPTLGSVTLFFRNSPFWPS